jgi:hypothetical protein
MKGGGNTCLSMREVVAAMSLANPMTCSEKHFLVSSQTIRVSSSSISLVFNSITLEFEVGDDLGLGLGWEIFSKDSNASEYQLLAP